MSNHKYRIYSKPLSEYLYRTLKALPKKTRQDLLSIEDQKIFASDTKLSDFCSKEQLDRILLTLTKIGKQWDLRIYDNEETANELEFAAVNQFQFPQKRVEVIEAMSRENIFYLDSSDVMLSSLISTNNIHSPVFQLSRQSRELSQKMSSIRSVRVPHDERNERALQAYQDLNKLFLEMLNAMTWARQTLSLEQGTIRVLAILFANQYSALTIQEIAEGTMMKDKMAFLTKNITSLLKDKLIISDKDHGLKLQIAKGVQNNKRTYYMLTAEGKRRIMEFNNFIHNKTFGK